MKSESESESEYINDELFPKKDENRKNVRVNNECAKRTDEPSNNYYYRLNLFILYYFVSIRFLSITQMSVRYCKNFFNNKI